MRYLVRARIKPGCEAALLKAIEDGTLGYGSVAEGEYIRNMLESRLCADGTARWVEVCYCATPLEEERPYWEEYFALIRVQDAHDRRQQMVEGELLQMEKLGRLINEEEYFDLIRVQDAHDRRRCRDDNGSAPWACNDCDCTERLERKLTAVGEPFIESIRSASLRRPKIRVQTAESDGA